jgi:hypothetical protein
MSSVVVTSAPASAAGGAARGVAQGQAQAQTGARDSIRASADIALRRALPPAVQRAEGAANFAGVAPTNFVGCYQVINAASWPQPLPPWFGIFSDSAPHVRLIRPGVAQRPVIGRWQNVSPTSITVTLDSSSTTSFTLTQIGTEIFATPTSPPATQVRVLRHSCAL